MGEIYEITGIIKAIKEREKNYSILLSDGMWYSGWNNDKPEGLTKEDKVSFKYQINGEYKNIIGAPDIIEPANNPTTTNSPTAEIPSKPKTESKEKPFTSADEYHPQIMSRDEQIRQDIRKQSALKSACSYLGNFATNTGDDNAVAERIIAFARMFEAYLAEN